MFRVRICVRRVFLSLLCIKTLSDDYTAFNVSFVTLSFFFSRFHLCVSLHLSHIVYMGIPYRWFYILFFAHTHTMWDILTVLITLKTVTSNILNVLKITLLLSIRSITIGSNHFYNNREIAAHLKEEQKRVYSKSNRFENKPHFQVQKFTEK